jgi:hypothetical protein
LRHVPRFAALLAVAVAATLTSPAGPAVAATPSLAAVSAVTPVWGTYQSVTPARVLDTRIGQGAPKAPIVSGGTVNLSVLGAAGVPATGVSAVVLNVTITGATKPGYLTVYPAGSTRPEVSSINFVAGTDRANLVTAPLGTLGTGAGKVAIYNPIGSVNVIADIVGYYVADGAAAAAGLYQYVTPERLFDSRDANYGTPWALGRGDWVQVPVSYQNDSDPANIIDVSPNIRALAVNITAVLPTKAGFVTAWDGGAGMPGTSTVNFAAGTITPNMAIVPVGPCDACTGEWFGKPSIKIISGSIGTVNLVVDIVGFYDDGQIGDGLRFKPLTPTRIVDTRTSLGTTTLTGASTRIVTAPQSVAGAATYSLVTNSTAVLPSLATHLTMWSNDIVMPGVSNLNAAKGQIVANATITDLGAGNKFDIFNATGTTNMVVDVVGSMEYIPNDVPPLAFAPADRPTIYTSNATVSGVRSSR